MTIKDIARLSGVSISTVSRVLNQRPDVSQRSREKVLKIIESEHYVPNVAARDLVRTQSDYVGLIVRGAGNPFFSQLIYSLEAGLEAGGYTLVVRQLRSEEDELTAAAALEREKRLQGLVFLGGRCNYRTEDMSSITVPYILVTYNNRFGSLDPERYSSVSIDDEDTAYRAVQELIHRGHRRIAALVGRTDDDSISQLRYQGYCRALEAAGIPLREELVFSGADFNLAGAYAAVQAGLQRCGDFTALFAISDLMAIGAMRALREAGRTLPDDCSVIGIDGLVFSEYLNPPLASMRQPVQHIGEAAAELLLQLLDGRGSHRHITVGVSFVPGASLADI